MADIDVSQGQGVPLDMVSKYVDMGDGTHALQVAIGVGSTITIPVTGPLTEVELAALYAGLIVAGTNPLTDAELRAVAVNVLGPLTDAELRAVSVDVELTAGEAHAGQVGGDGTTISITPTITAGAYAVDDAVGGRLEFANFLRIAGNGAILTNVVIIDDHGQDGILELWLFNQAFTAMADNAAWAPSEADLENLIGVVSTSQSAMGWLAAGTPSAVDIDVTKRIDLVGTTTLYGQLVTRTIITPNATDDITVKVQNLQD